MRQINIALSTVVTLAALIALSASRVAANEAVVSDRAIGPAEGVDAASIARQLDGFEKQHGDARAIVAFVERVLPGAADPALRWRLEMARQCGWEREHAHRRALENARRLLADAQTTSDEYDQLLDHEIFNLFNLHRVDEGIACCDRRISNATDDPAQLRRLLEFKAASLLDHVEPARGIPACREFRQATEPQTKSWATASAMLALVLARDGRHAEAIALRLQLEQYYRKADPLRSGDLLIEIARSQYALGHWEQAAGSLDLAERALSDKTDQRNVESLTEQITALRTLIRSKK